MSGSDRNNVLSINEKVTFKAEKGGQIGPYLVAELNAIEYVGAEVPDTGIGMSKEEQSRIFERFYRAEKSRGTPGSGLGLSLVHAIVNFYHGTIAVQSKPNSGTTFIVTLPA